MPEISRLPVRLNTDVGLDLVSPVDRMPPGSLQYAYNIRTVEEGRIDARPGYAPFGSGVGAPKLLHSIRRLNDPDASFAANGYTYIVGNGTTLESGIETAITQIDTGYSGNPLSLLAFRPDVSPESWMYVYDQNKQAKVRPDGAIRPIGVVPPNAAPNIEYGIPAFAGVVDGTSATGWGVAGTASMIATADRTNGESLTIAVILYNSGTTGWCCLSPSSMPIGWTGERMRVSLSGTENALVREIHGAIASTTISAIKYDSGTSGLCSIVLAGQPAGLARNSLIKLNSTEVVRVLSVVLSPDGTLYSLRCSTSGTFSATQSVTGLISWYTFTALNHAVSDAITSSYLAVTNTGAGVGAAAAKVVENAGIANNRPISIADDYLHISVFLQNPQNVVTLTLLIDVDPATVAGTAFSDNYYQWDIPQSQLGNFGSGSGDVWIEVVVPLSQGVRNGDNPNLTLTTVEAVGVALTTTGSCSFGFDWWYNFGTYGPVIQPNAPTGYIYTARYRDSSTGAASVPGPFTRYSLNPLREAVIVTPPTTNAAGIDYSDIYREGGTLTDFVYVASVQNISLSSFTDGLADATIAGNPGVDLTLLQPWPVLDVPWSGVVNVIGTSVTWVSGTEFNTNLVQNSIILLNGVSYLTRGQPKSATFLELQLDAGVLANAAYSIQSPTLAGQTLDVAFGPLEGPFAPVAFALGDQVNAGTLYYSNTSNLDGAADTNTIELCGPTEPLVTGETWNGLVFAGSRGSIYMVRFSFAQGLITGATPYQFSRLPSAIGFWSRWAICRGPDGVYALGRDGIYRVTEQGAENITDTQLYPLFPHDGQPAVATSGYQPVDMTAINFMRLSSQDNEIRFVYLDTDGNQVTLRWEVTKKRWFPHFYGDSMSYEYLDEPLVSSPNSLRILQLSRTLGLIYQIGGNTDNGVAITSQFQIPALDGGDERLQKLPTDYIVDADQTGTFTATQFYDNGVSASAVATVTRGAQRSQSIINISSVPGTLTLYRNISVKIVFTGGPAGPRFYATEPAFYLQPFLSTRVMTQFINLSFQGWKSHRRGYFGLISTADCTFLIQCQDGRAFNVTIPSTGGQYRVQTLMLPQNIKSLAFAYQVDCPQPFALFPESFTAEIKQWNEGSYVLLAMFKT